MNWGENQDQRSDISSDNFRDRDVRVSSYEDALSEENSLHNVDGYVTAQSESTDTTQAENEGRKFGTFPKQIKVYKKCRVNSLTDSNFSAASLDRRSWQCKKQSLELDKPGDRAATSDTSWNARLGIINKVVWSEENEYLRELIEDLKRKVQQKDAECLALQVALQRIQNVYHTGGLREGAGRRGDYCIPNTVYEESGPTEDFESTDSTTNSFSVPTPDQYGDEQDNMLSKRSKSEKCHTELGLLSHLRDELYSVNSEKVELENQNKTLVRTLETLNRNYSVTRQMFEVAMVKVQELEREVSEMPYLRERISQLQQEELETDVKLRNKKGRKPRPKSSKLDDVLGFIRRSRHKEKDKDGDANLDSCRNSLDPSDMTSSFDSPARLRLSWKGSSKSSSKESLKSLSENVVSLKARFTELSVEKKRLFDELQCCKLRNNEFQKELEGVHADRVRLSALEENLQKCIDLLFTLRQKFLSRRTLGKYLLDVLDDCYQLPKEDYLPEKFVSELLKKLEESDLLRDDRYYPHQPNVKILGEDIRSKKSRETLCFL